MRFARKRPAKCFMAREYSFTPRDYRSGPRIKASTRGNGRAGEPLASAPATGVCSRRRQRRPCRTRSRSARRALGGSLVVPAGKSSGDRPAILISVLGVARFLQAVGSIRAQLLAFFTKFKAKSRSGRLQLLGAGLSVSCGGWLQIREPWRLAPGQSWGGYQAALGTSCETGVRLPVWHPHARP